MVANTHDVAPRQLRLLTPNEAATVLRISHKTLEKWRAADEGPPWFVVGRRQIRYDTADLAVWIKTGRRLGDLIPTDGAA